MRQIKLIPAKPFPTNCVISIVDVTDGEKQRGKIKVEYARVDIKQLQDQGKDFEGAMEYFKNRVYTLVKYYIAGDWECVEGYEEVMDIIASHVKLYY